jgi:multiple sugar transport system permease protein
VSRVARFVYAHQTALHSQIPMSAAESSPYSDSFVSSWNNYFTPALILHENNKKTLPILLAQLRSADFLKFDMGKVYMMITFSILPVIVVYLILSKHIVGGVAMGSVKG